MSANELRNVSKGGGGERACTRRVVLEFAVPPT